MKYIHGEHEVEADTPEGIVAKMQEGSHDQGGTMREYMESAAARAEQMTGKAVRSDLPEHFVADLVAVGLLEEVR